MDPFETPVQNLETEMSIADLQAQHQAALEAGDTEKAKEIFGELTETFTAKLASTASGAANATGASRTTTSTRPNTQQSKFKI